MSDTEPVSERQVRVLLLGRFEVWVGNTLVISQSWSRRKARTLLKLVAVQRSRMVHREQVQEWLWPELDSTAAANNLHKNLHYLRTVFAEHGAASTVSLGAQAVVLAPEVWVDADAFRGLAKQARAAAHDARLYEQAAALYAGDLLPEDLYEDWAAQPRDELRSIYQELLLDLARLYAADGALERAVERLQQVVALDPLHEDAHRALMRAYTRLGRRHQALRQYQLCREALDRELGVEPSAETEALQVAILEGSDQLLGPPAATIATNAPAPTATILHARRQRPALRPLFGREPELEAIEDIVETAAAGVAQTLFIRGDAGIGKTHLAEHVLAIAEETHASLALVGRSYELDAPVSYRPVRQMLEQLVEAAPQHVEQALRGSLHLKRLLHSGDAEVRPVADPALLQLELFDEVIRLLSGLASRGRPLALLFDDLHAADEASVVFVHHLCRKLADTPTAAVVLATYRSEEAAAPANRSLHRLVSSLRRNGLLRELALEPLDEPFMRIVVERHFGSQPVDRDLVDTIVQRAEGNPLFAGEIVRMFKEEGRIHLADGRWRYRPGFAAARSVPTAIDDLLDRRLERLSDAAHAVLQAAAIVAGDIDFALLRRVVPLSEREILDGLDECLRAAVLDETPGGYRYRHGLLREAAYTRLSRARRQQLHRVVAEALAETAHSESARIGDHFAQSDQPWRAVAHLGRAAAAAAGVYDNQHAIELFERALALGRAHPDHVSGPQLAALLEELADLVRRTGDASRGAALFEEALRYVAAAGDAAAVFRVRGKAALSHIVGGEVAAASLLITDTLHAMAEAHPDSVPVGRTYYLLAQLRWHSGQYREALDAAEAAFRAAQTSEDVFERARAYEVLALACHSLGDWQKGVQYELSRDALQVPGFVDEALEVHL